MDMQQIKYFLALANEKSFTDAAEEMFISQSSLSKKIKALEKELNVVLFDRTLRKISLTQAGREFHVHALQMHKIYEQTLTSMHRYSVNPKKKLILTSTQVLSYYGLTDLIVQFCNLHDDIEIVVSELEPNKVVRELRNGNSDVGIIHYEYMQDDDFEYIPIYRDRMVAVTSIDHPLAAQEQVSMQQLTNETFLFIRINELDNKETIDICAKHGFMPRISPSNLRLNSMEKYLLRGNYIAIMPEVFTFSFHDPRIRRIKILETIPRTLCFVIQKGKTSMAADTFIAYVLEHCAVDTSKNEK